MLDRHDSPVAAKELAAHVGIRPMVLAPPGTYFPEFRVVARRHGCQVLAVGAKSGPAVPAAGNLPFDLAGARVPDLDALTVLAAGCDPAAVRTDVKVRRPGMAAQAHLLRRLVQIHYH